MRCLCSSGVTTEIKVEGDVGADPIWCMKCGCNWVLEDLPISPSLAADLSKWAQKYGEWIDWDKEQFTPNGEVLETEFNVTGGRLEERVREELGDGYKVEYIPSMYYRKIVSKMIRIDTDNIQDPYLPRHKFDFERVSRLRDMNKKEILPLLPGIMEWIQDMNWPIAHEVAELLLTYPDEIIPYIKDVLKTDDDVWKYWCLEFWVKKLPIDLIASFKDELIRLVERPTDGEIMEELDEVAKVILETID